MTVSTRPRAALLQWSSRLVLFRGRCVASPSPRRVARRARGVRDPTPPTALATAPSASSALATTAPSLTSTASALAARTTRSTFAAHDRLRAVVVEEDMEVLPHTRLGVRRRRGVDAESGLLADEFVEMAEDGVVGHASGLHETQSVRAQEDCANDAAIEVRTDLRVRGVRDNRVQARS